MPQAGTATTTNIVTATDTDQSTAATDGRIGTEIEIGTGNGKGRGRKIGIVRGITTDLAIRLANAVAQDLGKEPVVPTSLRTSPLRLK